METMNNDVTNYEGKYDERPKNFEVGKTYFCRSTCDYNCIWFFVVTRRTEKSIWIRETGYGKQYDNMPEKRKSVYRYEGRETVAPLGRSSMSPILTPDSQELPENIQSLQIP